MFETKREAYIQAAHTRLEHNLGAFGEMFALDM